MTTRLHVIHAEVHLAIPSEVIDVLVVSGRIMSVERSEREWDPQTHPISSSSSSMSICSSPGLQKVTVIQLAQKDSAADGVLFVRDSDLTQLHVKNSTRFKLLLNMK